MWPGERSELGWAKEGETGIAPLFRCSLTTANPNAVDKTATELMKMLYTLAFLRYAGIHLRRGPILNRDVGFYD